MTSNPFLDAWTTPFEAPPFGLIAAEHFGPAFEAGMAEHDAEIEAIAGNPAPADFDNTIVALELSGKTLRRVEGVFWNLSSADTNESLQEIERNISPVLAKHHQAISLNPTLFGRIDALSRNNDRTGLDDEQRRVLEVTHKGFVLGGARLDAAGRERLTAISERLAVLGTTFSQNVMADEKSYLLVLETDEDLEGLPQALRDAAHQAAVERGLMPGHYAITLSRSLIEPFLRFSSRRDLRAKAFAAWSARGENEGPHDNRPIVAETLKLRSERAALLGFESFADFKLEDTMAKTPDAVRALLDRVWNRAKLKVAEESRVIQGEAARDGSFELEPYDWRYYAEKVRQAHYDLDESEIKSYLVLDDIIAAAFDTAEKLFGIVLTERQDVPVYHPDVRAFEVADRDGRHLALFLGDYFARPSKRSGAWNSGFRQQSKLGGETRPIVVNVMNFARGGEGESTLLSVDDARTLFHEFGHALHSMLTDVTYPSIAGTNVARDFVEFPSQLYEHWLMRPEVLRRFARHAVTREPMPESLLGRIMAAKNFNQGFAAIEFCSSALVDLDFHTLAAGSIAQVSDPIGFERRTLERIGMPRAIAMRHRTPHFAHVFSGDGYSAGYYSYLWSEMLDADGFGAFEEGETIFDAAAADRLRTHVLSAGNRERPEKAYMAFRGRMPSVDILLQQRGLA